MNQNLMHFNEWHALKKFITKNEPAIYTSSQTSTVIPYDHLKKYLKPRTNIVSLSTLPPVLRWESETELLVSGQVTWEDASKFCHQYARTIMTSPTEQLALVTAGAATSCTGERCFGFGTFRDQIKKITYLNYLGEEKTLDSSDPFPHHPLLENYQKEYEKFKNFKNAPFPRFEKATDLMIGTEGQLGIIKEVTFLTAKQTPIRYLFLLLPHWKENIDSHLEIAKKVQLFRASLMACEFVDANCIKYLPTESQIGNEHDIIFLEIREHDFDLVFTELISNLSTISADQIFEITSSKYHDLRMSIPRHIFEQNQKMNVVKMGTDVQVSIDRFSDLFKFYQKSFSLDVPICLFGHFGDCHLHLNFLPTKAEINKIQDYFLELYHFVEKVEGSPFAEHGIGLLKKDFIANFYSPHQIEIFKWLKSVHDPFNQFFPEGFMSV